MIEVNNLVKNFVEVIAAQWSKSGIETVEQAMDIAEKEYKKKKTVTKVTKKESITPNWIDKEIKEEIASDEEIRKLESRMKRG